VDRFSNEIIDNAPPASRIKSIDVIPAMIREYESFTITESRAADDQITEVSPDIAVCEECLADMSTDTARIDYPFINCTNCGPRFSIINGLPYDRPLTTMKDFRMCGTCTSEYNDITNRRFHAQPIACNFCGPVYRYTEGGMVQEKLSAVVSRSAGTIDSGGCIALKGVGGFHLACDALDNNATERLRRKKNRDAKPFAVMFRDIETLKEFCYVSPDEENQLVSWIRPVVILRNRKKLAPSVSSGLGTTGAMLPFMPFHYLLFRALKTPVIVLTSGNLSEEPVIMEDEEAVKKLSGKTDALVTYNREISNRVDDSVIRVSGEGITIIRRSRGFVPRPVDLNVNAEGILALGAEQKNSFCIGRKHQAIMSQYIGDLKNPVTCDFYRESIGKFTSLFRFTPRYIVNDLHPDYYSSGFAAILSEKYDIPQLAVQHHHAHIVSCMAEYGLDEKVIGVSLDGTGYGTDGNIWGGEFLIADCSDFERFTHFDYVPMPGGDKAADEPWRMALSYLYRYFGESLTYETIDAFRRIEKTRLNIVKEMIVKGINSPLSSGAGRLFDAVSALTGLCRYSSFDSEAPMRLESVIDHASDKRYPFKISGTVIFADTFRSILDDLRRVEIPEISVRFHNTVVQVILEVSEMIRESHNINKVILSGGVFQNMYILEKTVSLLRQNMFEVYTNHQVPVNDGGISLGQMVVASKYFGLCA
jgi:hydrogenase maturation protein HypF